MQIRALNKTIPHASLVIFNGSSELEPLLLHELLLGMVLRVGCKVEIRGSIYTVTFCSPSSASNSKDMLITKRTEVEMERSITSNPKTSDNKEFWTLAEQIYGNKWAYQALGTNPPTGILLSGPPGAGKTTLATNAAMIFGSPLFIVSGSSAYSENGEFDLKSIKNITMKAKSASTVSMPATILFDEVDALGTSREINLQSSGLVYHVLDLIDDLKDSQNYVVVMATTNRPEVLDQALRRSGRFDKEIVVEIPDQEQRESYLSKFLPNVQPDIVHCLAQKTNGYAVADLMTFGRELQVHLSEDQNWFESAEELISHSLNRIGTPSLLREYQLRVENMSWSNLRGTNEIQNELERLCMWPLLHKPKFNYFGIKPTRGILLYGPPGCSKTTIARILGNEIGYSFFSLSGASIYSAFVGESENIVRSLFARARNAGPSIIFLDEIDSLVGKRGLSLTSNSVQDRILSTILNELDGIENCNGVLIIVRIF